LPGKSFFTTYLFSWLPEHGFSDHSLLKQKFVPAKKTKGFPVFDEKVIIGWTLWGGLTSSPGMFFP
jgi:hypothetical protein